MTSEKTEKNTGQTINITCNGSVHHVDAERNLKDVLTALGYAHDGTFAVAVNQQFVPRSDYMATRIQPHDQLEVIAPMQGG